MEQNGMKALTLYWSAGGYTKELADAVRDFLVRLGVNSEMQEIGLDLDVDCSAYSVVIMASPVYGFLPPLPVKDFLNGLAGADSSEEDSQSGTQRQYCAVFCTPGCSETEDSELTAGLSYMSGKLKRAGMRVEGQWPVRDHQEGSVMEEGSDSRLSVDVRETLARIVDALKEELRV